MAVDITERLRKLLASPEKEVNIIVKFDNFSTLFGSRSIGKFPRYGDPELPAYGEDSELRYGRLYPFKDQKTLISMQGTDVALSQQLSLDRGAARSTTSLSIRFIDKDGYMTRLITPGQTFGDILGQNATIWFNLLGASHPEDSLRILRCSVTEVTTGPGWVDLLFSDPQQNVRRDIYIKRTTKLTTRIDYESQQIQDLFYRKRTWIPGSVSIQYIVDQAPDNEFIALVGSTIVVHIANDTTASDIRGLIEDSADALNLVDVTVSGDSGAVQIVQAPTLLQTDTEAYVESIAGFIEPQDIIQTYIKIEDELIEVDSFDANTNRFLGLTRAQLDTVGRNHDVGTEVESFYRLQGPAVDLALKIYLSGGPQYWKTGVEVSSFVFQSINFSANNAIFFRDLNIQDTYSLVAGDLCSVVGSTAGNNFTDATIVSFGRNEIGSFIIIDQTLSQEITTSATISFRSQFNTLPAEAGCAMVPDQVDVARFVEIRDLFSTNLSTVDAYVKDTIKATELVDEQILFETGMNAIPRKARASVNLVHPPLATEQILVFDESVITQPQNMVVRRSTRQNFYNHVIFEIDEDSLEDRFLREEIRQSSESVTKIPIGVQALRIKAKTLKTTSGAAALVDRASTRLLDRYRFGSEIIQLTSQLGKLQAEVGDAVLFGGTNLNLADITQGNRKFEPRLFQVIDRRLSLKSAQVQLTLINAGLGTQARFGVISPSSYVDSGATTTLIPIQKSFGTYDFELETDKWRDLAGFRVLVHSDDWTVQGISTIKGISSQHPSAIELLTPLAFTPPIGYTVDVVQYDDVSSATDSGAKDLFVFMNPTVPITAGISATSFTVGASDIGKFSIGNIVMVHNVDYSIESAEIEIENISGNDIILESSLGFTPDNTYSVELIGFKDGGAPYRFF